MGCEAPQTNCPIAIAKLIVAMPRPVVVFSGETNSPIDCRAPIVIIRMAAATSMKGHTCAPVRATVGPAEAAAAEVDWAVMHGLLARERVGRGSRVLSAAHQ